MYLRYDFLIWVSLSFYMLLFFCRSRDQYVRFVLLGLKMPVHFILLLLLYASKIVI